MARPKLVNEYAQDPGWIWESLVTGTFDRVVVYDANEAHRAGLLKGTPGPYIIAFYAIDRGAKAPPIPVDSIAVSGQTKAKFIAKEIAEGRATMTDHGGRHTTLPVEHASMPIVILDPQRAGEALVDAIDKSVTPSDIAATVKAMLNATKASFSKEGDTIEQPDWTARHQAIRFYADYLIGKPTQRTEMRLNQGEDDGDLMDKLKNPAMARAIFEAMREVNPDAFRALIGEMK